MGNTSYKIALGIVIFCFFGLILTLLLNVYVVFVNKPTSSVRSSYDLYIEKDGPLKIQPQNSVRKAGTILFDNGSVSYRVFDYSLYEKALIDDKVILLFFCAEWNPICEIELADIGSGFERLNNPNIVGFFVHFKDETISSDEKAIIDLFSINDQHTKLILKQGEEIYRSSELWSGIEFNDIIGSL